MFAHRVVEALDVIEHIGPGFFPCPVDLAAEPFGLHRREEALHRGVVPAFTTPAHAAGDALCLEQLLEELGLTEDEDDAMVDPLAAFESKDWRKDLLGDED